MPILNSREEQRLLADKLAQIERKIIVGGENLLEKAELQAKLLEENEKKLEKQRAKAAEIKQKLDEKEVNNKCTMSQIKQILIYTKLDAI